MAIKDCLGKLEQAGIKISEFQKESLQNEADRLANIYRAQNKFPEGQIQNRAELDAIENLLSERRAIKFSESMYVKRLKENSKFILNHKMGAVAGLRELLVPLDNAASTTSIDNLSSAMFGKATTRLGAFIERFHSKIPGGIDTFFRSNRNAIADVAKALHGDTDVPEVALKFAKAYNDSRNILLDQLRKAGVRINTLEDFGVKHKWDFFKVDKMTEDEYTELLMGALDPAKHFDRDGRLLTKEGLENVVRTAYRNQILGEVSGSRNMLAGTANSFAESHRVFHFKSGADYLRVFDQIGSGELFDTMMESLQELATDAAIASKLGPDPDRVFNELDKLARLEFAKAKKSAKEGLKPATIPENTLLNNRMIYNYLRGTTSGLGNPLAASAFSTIRNFITGSKLGSAALAAIGDQTFIRANAKLLGMSYRKIAGKQLAAVFSGKTAKEQRELAIRLGLLTDWAFGIARAGNRFGDVSVAGKVSGMSASFADFTLRSSGLSRLTREGKQAYALELNSFLYKHRLEDYSELPFKLRASLIANNIDAGTWDKIRHSVVELGGVGWLDPEGMERDASLRFLGFIHNEVRHAIPEPGAEVRTLMTQGAAAGTAAREVAGIITQFRGFTLSTLLNNLRKTLFHPANQGAMNKLKYASNLIIYGTLVGAISLTLRDLKDGKDPRDPTDPQFLLDAIVQAGVYDLGLFIPTGLDQPAKGEVGALYAIIPPMVRLFAQVYAFSTDTPKNIAQGKQPLKPAVDLLAKNVPLNLWYTSLIMQRLIIDQLKKMASKNSSRSFKRQETMLKKRTDQKYWWRPGKTAPSRGPEITEK